MVRAQVQLTESQAAALKALAAERDVSMAEIVRLAVDELLACRADRDPEERRSRSLAVVGAFRSGMSDVSERHDEHLARAFRR